MGDQHVEQPLAGNGPIADIVGRHVQQVVVQIT